MKYQLKPVINASGRMTILGVSTPAGGDRCSQLRPRPLLRGEGSGQQDRRLSGGLAGRGRCGGGLLRQRRHRPVGGRRDSARRPHRLEQLRPCPPCAERNRAAQGAQRQLRRPGRYHGQPGGGKVVEAGYANECSAAQLAAAINASTAAILYIKSHHCVQKSILSVAEAAEVAKAHGLPLIVDAAAEEDLRLYYNLGRIWSSTAAPRPSKGPPAGWYSASASMWSGSSSRPTASAVP